ncbi:4Fe-4S dicluster domain-containing protein [Jannaschia sp. Os4]|uniref:4Fe-4S dicluster domain-containing protein n=1 Tax=Jannaschia sp. Os4 TaxID=2807617 RepID=UPI00193AA708|nr:4Fe-4S dicluster domain-containing protein [Jannaschia sp. Os4]MBM2575195.1 4Fe-4S dicluster domain-containing protein [Jannaschia sp. Os4]
MAPHPHSIAHATTEAQAMMDAIRHGPANPVRSRIPDDPTERARHLLAFARFSDADLAATVPAAGTHGTPVRNPDMGALTALLDRQTKTLAAGIDLIMADLRESAATEAVSAHHGHALILAIRDPRPPRTDEPGHDWIADATAARGAIRASEIAVVLASYLRVLGWDATAHTPTTHDVDLPGLARRGGLPTDGVTLAAVTTTLPLAEARMETASKDPYARRPYHLGPHPFESLRRVDAPTTYIDEPNVPRVPKRADLFARAQFGDLGPKVQRKATAGHYVRKAAPSAAQRRLLGALVLLQDGAPEGPPQPLDPQAAAENVKAASYFLGLDAVGISRCPDWAWYSHDAAGDPIDPPHPHAISMIVDQGWETMEGASGDDWISVAQSMRAYLRFSLLGSVLARHIRRLGYSAKAHTVLDGEVLQPPLLLLAGLGEVSRIGEVILNPFLGPRLKSGVVTTDLPLAHDRPIDFGLQTFCDGCNKCARECPSGAITAGPKTMFNGYEIWKSDSQKCATYRITTEGGAMCGRCMKTCPWNLQGIFAEKPFRWAAMKMPRLAPALQRLDDALGRGGIDPSKKWWWDLELQPDGGYAPTDKPVNARGISPGLEVRAEDQTMAVYPAPLTPPPAPYPYPMDREAGIAAHRAMPSVAEYKRRRDAGDETVLDRVPPASASPVLRLEVAEAERRGDVMLLTLRDPTGADLPAWDPGAHVDLMVAPEYLRPYSLTGDPEDGAAYRIAVLREDAGRGGSTLLHRIFAVGRRVFAAPPANHFPLDPQPHTLLLGGGIGVTPMIPMAWALHRAGLPFALHYAVPTRARAALWPEIAAAPWAASATLHVSDEGTRADLAALTHAKTQTYACGPDALMRAAQAAGAARGIPVSVELFAPPEEEARPSRPFTLIAGGRRIEVGADETAAEAMIAAGLSVDVKCADGLCGVCRRRVVAGDVDHRDHVLSEAERADWMITCRSRAAEEGGTVEID